MLKNCSSMSDYEEDSIDVQSFSKLSLLVHWVARTVQKPHTSGQQSVIDELFILEPRSWPVKEFWNFYSNSTG